MVHLLYQLSLKLYHHPLHLLELPSSTGLLVSERHRGANRWPEEAAIIYGWLQVEIRLTDE